MKTSLLFVAVSSSMIALSSSAVTASTVVGYLGNFDVNNPNPEPADDFEIHLPAVIPGQVQGTWNFNPHYHTPSISSETGGTLVHYVSPTANVTPSGGIEHFGVILPSFPTGTTFQWSQAGAPLGQPEAFPMPQPPVIIPAPPPTPENPNPVETIQNEVRNESAVDSFFVERLENHVAGEVELGNLLTDNPMIMGATPIDDHPKLLRPGQTLTDDNPIGADDLTQSDVQILQVFANDNGHQGALIGTFMTAAIVSVPEPSSIGLLMIGAAGWLMVAKRKRIGLAG